MGKLIAIGGGGVGVQGTRSDTLSIDKEIVRLSGKKNPKLLFIPTASSDPESYYDLELEYFGRLGCKVDVLYLIKEELSKNEISEKILNSDIIYVGVGDTLKMMNIWRKKGVDHILRKAYKNDIVLSGLSAGAICWFKYGCSDSRKFSKFKDKKLIKVSGLGLIDATLSVHHLTGKNRKKGLIEIMKRTPGIAIALDDYSALEIIGNDYRIITSRENSNAYKVYSKAGKVHYELIEKSERFKTLSKLLAK